MDLNLRRLRLFLLGKSSRFHYLNEKWSEVEAAWKGDFIKQILPYIPHKISFRQVL